MLRTWPKASLNFERMTYPWSSLRRLSYTIATETYSLNQPF
jgi:hypothetical protein